MRITNIKATAVNVPLAAPIRWSWGVRRETTRLIIQVETDEGICGLGETMGRVGADSVHYESRKLIGEDPFNVERILAILRPRPYFFGYAGHGLIAGIEMACWDIIGKTVGKPVWPSWEADSAGRSKSPATSSPAQKIKRPAKAVKPLRKNCSNSAKTWFANTASAI